MLIQLTFPEKLYLGTEGPLSTENPTLGFATPDGTDSAARKRKATVDQWTPEYRYTGRNVNGEYIREKFETNAFKGSIDNVPLSGFRLGGTINRYTTSNKWFEIIDPRGFKLQISSYNLQEICAGPGIVGGVLQGEFIWCRDKAQMHLISTESVEYKEFAKSKISPKAKVELVVGDVINHKTRGENLQFIGKFYIKSFDYKEDYTVEYPRGYLSGGQLKYRYEFSQVDKPKAYFFFMKLDDMSYYNENSRRRIVIISEMKQDSFEVIDNQPVKYELPLDTLVMMSYNDRNYGQGCYFYETKQAMLDRDIDLETMKEEYKVLYKKEYPGTSRELFT